MKARASKRGDALWGSPHEPTADAPFPALARHALDWQRDGLNPPESMFRDRDDYLEDQDDIKRWMRRDVEFGPDFLSLKKNTYASYKAFCEDEDIKPIGAKSLTGRLKQLGYKDKEVGHDNALAWIGFRTKTEALTQHVDANDFTERIASRPALSKAEWQKVSETGTGV